MPDYREYKNPCEAWVVGELMEAQDELARVRQMLETVTLEKEVMIGANKQLQNEIKKLSAENAELKFNSPRDVF